MEGEQFSMVHFMESRMASCKGCKLSVQQDWDVTLFRSSQDFHDSSITRRSAEKVLDSFKGDFTKLPLLNKYKEKTTVSFQASGPFAQYLHALPPSCLTFLKCTRSTTSKLSSVHRGVPRNILPSGRFPLKAARRNNP